MSTRTLIGMALLLAGGAGSAEARQMVDVRSAAEQARLAAHRSALEVQEALLAAQLHSGFRAELVQYDVEHAMMEAREHLARIEPSLMAHQLDLERLQASLFGSATRSWQRQLDGLRPAEGPSLPQDAADSLYRAGRERLNRNEWNSAAEAFRRIRTEDRYSRSGYRAEAYYWEAFALSRAGSADELRRARELLTGMQSQYPNEPRLRDAQTLAATIDGRLARVGDAEAAQQVYANAIRTRASTGVAVAGQSGRNPQCNDEEDIRIAALSALLKVDSDRAVPVLREVLQRRDECSAQLRRRAAMLVARSNDPQATNILVDVARNDPDDGVRQQAVLYLGSVKTPEAATALQTILQSSTDPDLQRRALTALAQQRGDEANAMLREYAGRENISPELRRQAVMLLVSRRNGGVDENAAFLRELYGRTGDAEVRGSIISVLGRADDPANSDWLMGIAMDRSQDVDVRKQALYLAGRSDSMPVARLITLYDQVTDAEMKEQVLYTLARRSDEAALDKLISVARGDTNVEMRKKAIFWLGQSKNPRASEALLEIIR